MNPERQVRPFRTDPGRARVNPYAGRLDEFPALILPGDAAEALSGRWREHLGVPRGVWLEIGPGNGFFLSGIAARHPDRGFVGVEVRYKRCWLCAKKLAASGRTNARVVHHHAAFLADLFAEGELSGVYIHHPDPWPRERQHKHRLVQPALARTLESRVARGGEVRLKSDFAPYLPVMREAFAGTAFVEEAFTADINRDGEPLGRDDILTNYQKKSIARGQPVFFVSFRRT